MSPNEVMLDAHRKTVAVQVEAIDEIMRAEPLTWEATTPGYTRFVSDRRYRLFSPKVRRWYRPICPNCGPRKRWPAIEVSQ